MKKLALIAAATSAMTFAAAAEARDQIRMVGSSTVFPFSSAVAEQFGSKGAFKTPVVESTGTGGGMKLFCGGVGADHPDLTGASRAMKKSEYEQCVANGVTEVVEVKIGFDGIVVANATDAPNFVLDQGMIFKAVAKQLPKSNDDCTLIDNPNQKWSDIDATLPQLTIEIFGPPPTSGTRDAFAEIALEKGAESFACLKQLKKDDSKAFTAIAHTIREDGKWIDAGENDNAIVNTLLKTPTALGVFGYSFLDQNSDRIKGAEVGGVSPTFDAIADGSYKVSRSLFFYVKKQHIGVIPGIKEFLAEYTSEGAGGTSGYLADKGLIPLPDDQRKAWAEKANGLALVEADKLK